MIKKGLHISYLNRKLDFKIEINPKTSRQKPMLCGRILIFEVLLFQLLKVFSTRAGKKVMNSVRKESIHSMTKLRVRTESVGAKLSKLKY